MQKRPSTDPYRYFLGLMVAARHGKGVSQTELASRLDKPQSYVSKYENNRRKLNIVEFLNICRALKVDAQKLIHEMLRILP